MLYIIKGVFLYFRDADMYSKTYKTELGVMETSNMD